jgi:hypothetical protein
MNNSEAVENKGKPGNNKKVAREFVSKLVMLVFKLLIIKT